MDPKCQKFFLQKSNPRKVRWTALYRRKHKKGTLEETGKKKTRKAAKFQRAVVGATLNEILAKRNQKPEVRKVRESRPSEPPRRLKWHLSPRRLVLLRSPQKPRIPSPRRMFKKLLLVLVE